VANRLKGPISYKGPPTRSGVHAEGLLLGLASEPKAILNVDLIDSILSLRPPLALIAEDERTSLRKMAEIADVGLSAALEELTLPSQASMHATKLRILRVALAVVEQELDNGAEGEWRVLESLWRIRSHGLVYHLVDIFIQISIHLKANFAFTPPPPMVHELVHQLFRAAIDVLKLVTRLAPTYTPTSRAIRSLTVAVADVFVCTDGADMSYTQSSSTCVAAQEARQSCIHLVRTFSDPGVYFEHGNSGAELVMQTLLKHGIRQSDSSDPVYHVLQVFCLIDHLLPLSSLTTDELKAHWVTTVLPNSLQEVRSFFCILDVENKVHFVKRLVNLDANFIGIGEWLLMEELREVIRVMQSLNDGMTEETHRLVGHHQIFLSIRFVFDLLTSQSSASLWCIESLATVTDLSNTFTAYLMTLHYSHVCPPLLTRIVQVLADSDAKLHTDLNVALLLTLYRAVQHHGDLSDTFGLTLRLLDTLPAEHTGMHAVRLEMGHAIATLGQLENLNENIADIVLSTLEWLSEQPDATLKGITADGFSSLCDQLSRVLQSQRTGNMPAVVSKVTVQPSSPAHSPVTLRLPQTLSLSLDSVSDLLRPPLQIPSTPKRTTASEEVFNLVTVSPPTALLRSPAVVTGLTKTYLNNDFRQLRSSPSSTRQNTSRLPSMHVDVGINTLVT
jgi:hypothetical protein